MEQAGDTIKKFLLYLEAPYSSLGFACFSIFIFINAAHESMSMSTVDILHCMSGFLVGLCADWQKNSRKPCCTIFQNMFVFPLLEISLHVMLQMVEVALKASNSLMSP